MRILLAISAAAVMLLAGCSGSNEPSTDTTDSDTASGTDSGTSSGGGSTGPGGGVVGNATSYDCTTNVGGSGNAYSSVGGQNVGGCVMGTTEGVGVITALTPATGCTVWHDETPGDGQSDPGAVAVGDEVEEDWEFGVYCDATMSPNSASSMAVTYTA